MKKKFLQKKLIILLSIFIFAVSFSVINRPARAASIFEKANSGFGIMVNKAYGINEKKIGPNTFAENLIFIINYLLTFVGAIILIILIYAGYLWMTARGNEEQIEKAKKIMREAIIGLILVFFARIITEVLLTLIDKALTPPETT